MIVIAVEEIAKIKLGHRTLGLASCGNDQGGGANLFWSAL